METSSSTASRPASLALILVLCFVIAVPWLGLAPFSTRGEPREALVPQAMLATGEWVLPRGYSEDVPSKPPFMHWLIGGVSRVTGEVNEFTSRLPSALAAMLFIGAFYLFVARRISSVRAATSCLLLMFSVEWFRASIACRVDMTLAALLAGALLALFAWTERDLKGFPWGAAFLLVAATLTKGPVSIALPGAILGGYLLLERKPLPRLIGKGLLLGVPVALAASVWYLLAWQRGGEDFAAKVLYENVARFSSSMEDKPHAHSAFYLYLTVLIGFIPWTIMLGPSLVRAGWSRVRRGGYLGAARRSIGSLAPFERYALLAIVAFLIFFSIPSSKRGVYLLPVYPFIAVFVARFVEVAVRPEVWRRSVRAIGVVMVVLIGAVAAYQAGLVPLTLVVKKSEALFDATYFASQLGALGGDPIGCLTAVILLILGVGAIVRPWRGREFGHVIVLLGVLFIAANAVVVPALQRPLSLKRYATDIAPSVRAGEKLYSFGTEFYGVSFYLHREIYRVTPEIETGARVLVLDRNIERLNELLGAGRIARVISVSSYGVVKPRDRIALVEVARAG